jgi:hypothetical protein
MVFDEPRNMVATEVRMSDLIGTFRSYALDKDNCPRMDSEVVYVRVGLLKEAAARIEALEAALRPFADESLWCGPQHEFVTVKRSDCDEARAALEAENARLREALEKIAYDSLNCTPFSVARAALTRPDRLYNVAERLFGNDD